MTKFVVRMDGEVRCRTDWLPAAEAAWDRASRDRNAAQHGGLAELEIDGRVISRVRPKMGVGHPWPVHDDAPTNPSDVAAAVLQLCRVAGVAPDDLAAEMGAQGLPTTRSRLKSISTTQQGHRSMPTAAELVVICYAAIGRLKNQVRTAE